MLMVGADRSVIQKKKQVIRASSVGNKKYSPREPGIFPKGVQPFGESFTVRGEFYLIN